MTKQERQSFSIQPNAPAAKKITSSASTPIRTSHAKEGRPVSDVPMRDINVRSDPQRKGSKKERVALWRWMRNSDAAKRYASIDYWPPRAHRSFQEHDAEEAEEENNRTLRVSCRVGLENEWR